MGERETHEGTSALWLLRRTCGFGAEDDIRNRGPPGPQAVFSCWRNPFWFPCSHSLRSLDTSQGLSRRLWHQGSGSGGRGAGAGANLGGIPPFPVSLPPCPAPRSLPPRSLDPPSLGQTPASRAPSSMLNKQIKAACCGG